MPNPNSKPLAAGLYLIATPIGTARDITLRALDILAAADVLVAEDTRSLRRLMEIHGVPFGDRPMYSYHEHNGGQMRPRLMAALADGKSVVYASEAGTPMISDPGFDLARAAREEGFALTSAPGASAVITALTLAGLPTDRFFFAGFLPSTKTARRRAWEEVSAVPGTLVFYESPQRVAAMLEDAADILGDREGALARELTKKFEEVRRGKLSEIALSARETPPKGEIVVLIERRSEKIRESVPEERLREQMQTMSVRDAVDFITAETGLPRRQVYQMAVKLSGEA